MEQTTEQPSSPIFKENERKRLQTFLRMMKSDQPGERKEAGRQFTKFLEKHNLVSVLADNPEWLVGRVGNAQILEMERRLDDALAANEQFAAQNEAIRKENEKLRGPSLRKAFAQACRRSLDNPVAQRAGRTASIMFRAAAYAAAGPLAFGARHLLFGHTQRFQEFFRHESATSAYFTSAMFCMVSWAAASGIDSNMARDRYVDEEIIRAEQSVESCSRVKPSYASGDLSCSSLLIEKTFKTPLLGREFGPILVHRKPELYVADKSPGQTEDVLCMRITKTPVVTMGYVLNSSYSERTFDPVVTTVCGLKP